MARQLEELFIQSGFDASDIDIAGDAQSAAEALRANRYAIAVVDLTLPYIKGRQASFVAVENLLLEIFETDSLNTPADIIGITKESDAVVSTSKLIGSH